MSSADLRPPKNVTSVGAIVVGPDGVLLVKMAYGPTKGQYMPPGGIVDPGETLDDAVVREVLEETGVTVAVEGLAAVDADRLVITYPNGDRAQYLTLTFACRPLCGTARVADDESTDVGWFSPDDLPEPMVETSRDRIAHALALRAGPGRGAWFARP